MLLCQCVYKLVKLSTKVCTFNMYCCTNTHTADLYALHYSDGLDLLLLTTESKRNFSFLHITNQLLLGLQY